MGGGGGAMGGGGGSACASCPTSTCGYVDAGAGCAELYCGGCAAGTECGVRRANRCDQPRLCSQDGWCFENPLPQGNTIRGSWAAGPREVYLVGDNATALLWNGERHSVIALPPVEDGIDFYGVHGTSPQDLFIVGTRGTILHFDGTSWTQEFIEGGSTARLQAVLARSGAPTVAVGTNNEIVRRHDDAGWTDDNLNDGTIAFTGVGPDSEGRLYALGTYSSGSVRAVVMREGNLDSGMTVFWTRESRPPLLTGNALWASSDGGLFIAGLSDAGIPRPGMVLRRTEDAGWAEVLRVPDELRTLTGVTSDELFAAGNNGLFVHFVDGGLRTARAGSQWHTLALADQGPIVEGFAGQVARFSIADGGLAMSSSGTTRNVNQICGSTTNGLFAAAEGTPGCTGALCTPFAIEHDGGLWVARAPRNLDDTSHYVACGALFDFRWLVGDDVRYTASALGAWQLHNPMTNGLPRTNSTSIWVERASSWWITNKTEPMPPALPHVTHATGTPFSPTHRAVFYDGSGDLITAMGGELNQGWALGQRGLAFMVETDGGLTPVARLGSEDFTAIADEALNDGGTLTIATGLNGALYREETVAGFVAEQNLEADLFAAWVGPTGDSYVVGADSADGGRRVSRVYRRVNGNWVKVPFAGDRALSTVWAGTRPDGGHSVWVGAPAGWILSRP